MKKFFEEYGQTILTAVAVIILIAMCSSIGNLIKINVISLVDSFGTKTLSMFEDALETVSYIGYYADIDGDGTVDGVIFADLAFSNSGEWHIGNKGKFSYSAETNLKKYKITKETYTTYHFGTHKVIYPADNTTGNDRFYVVALKDIDNKEHHWYNNASISDYSITSENFGSGWQNTKTMIDAWNDSLYGEQDSDDMWGLVQEQFNNGWFIPSRAEWAAIAIAFKLNVANYDNFGFRIWYWSSSITPYKEQWAYGARTVSGYMSDGPFNENNYVRLITTY